MPGITLGREETFEEGYRKFKKQVDRNLIVVEKRQRKFHETAAELKKKRKIATRKKILKKIYMIRRYENRL